MSKPFKFRYVNELVGVFVIIVVALLTVSVVLVGKSHEWFVPYSEIEIEFPREGSFGLKVGSEVRILGLVVGRVDDIDVTEEGRVNGRISIREDFLRFIRTDSVGLVKKTGVVFGDTFIELTQGKGPQIDSHSVLPCEKGIDVVEVARSLLDEVHEHVAPVLEDTHRTIRQFGTLAATLQDESENLHLALLHLRDSLANIERITAGVDKGKGTAGKILRDPAIAGEIETGLKRVNQSLKELEAVIKDLKQTSSQLPRVVKKVDSGIDRIPGLAGRLQDSLEESDRLIEGLQKHWIIRDYIDQLRVGDGIPASRVRD